MMFRCAGYTRSGTARAGGEVTQPPQWSSEVHAPELALIYYKTPDGCKAGWTCAKHAPGGREAVGRLRVNFRYYNPADGRWTRRDPAGIEGGLNLYGYASNFAITQVDILGLLVMMECTRYGDEYGSMRCSISIYNDLCRCNECQKYADSVYTARNNNALLENIALLKSCAKKRKPDQKCKSFPTNAKANIPNGGIPANQYYRLYPKPNGGKQDSKGKSNGMIYHKGTPSPTSLEYGPSQAGEVKDTRVGDRYQIRIHPEGESHGCITVTGTCMGKPLTSVVEGEGLIEQLMMQHKTCGGMYLHIVGG